MLFLSLQEKFSDKKGTMNKEKINNIAKHFRHIMETLGLDLDDDSLSGTPERVAKMYINEVFSGLDPQNFPKITLFKKPFHNDDQIIVVKDIKVNSFCEHHFVPMTGIAHVAYIPNEHIIGLSKINRIVEYFAKRPQIQERLTSQIAESISEILKTENVAVKITLTHFCMTVRGVCDMNSTTTTEVLKGTFKKNPGRL